MKAAAVLLALAAAARAAEWDDALASIRGALAAEDFAAARAHAEAALERWPGHEHLLEQRARAVEGMARDVQRVEGYAAALDFLESRVDHPLLLEAYLRTAVWGGRERRALRRDDLTEEQRAWLVMLLGDWDAAADALERAGHPNAAWYREQADLRARLSGRASSAAWIAGLALAALLGGAWALLRRVSRPPRATS